MRIFGGRLEGSTIVADTPVDEIFDYVMSNGVAVLKGVFPKEEIDALRTMVFEWGLNQSPLQQSEFYVNKQRNHYCVERGVSPGQKTLHNYRSYNFNHLESLPDALRAKMEFYCAAIRDFYNSLTGSSATLHQVDGRSLHPQVIYYPTGGGHFARHTHPLEPQKIGFITALSQIGEDFSAGGAGFEANGKLVAADVYHDAGDIAMFRFDIPHWVSAVDIEEKMDPTSPRGRWTMTMSYY